MRQTNLVFAVLISVLFITGCNLESSSRSETTLPPSPTTDVPVETATLTATTTVTTLRPPTSAPPTARSEATLTTCPSPTDWTDTYAVQSGDTLSAIARRTSTTVETLRSVNCLADANQITVGQVLYVPIVPVAEDTPLGPPSPNPVQVGGKVTVDPILREDSGWLVLQAGATVTLSWPDAEQLGAVNVHFTLAPTGTGATPTILGFDYDTSDGVAIQWVVPEGIMGHLEARAGTQGGSVLVDTTEVPVSIIAESAAVN